MEAKKGCLGYLLSFLTMFVLVLVLAGEIKQVRAENCTEHVYDYECDTRCNECGEFRTVMHSYTERKMNETHHWYECVCGEKAGISIHNYGVRGNDNSRCEHCEYTRHEDHEFLEQKSNGTYHWMECACGAITSHELHEFKSNKGTCNACGQQQPAYYDKSSRKVRDKETYLSLEEAGAYLREQMVSRVESLPLMFYLDEDRYLNDGQLWDIIFQETKKHTGVPNEGDFLMWNWHGAWYDMEVAFENGVTYVKIPHVDIQYYSNWEKEQVLAAEIERVLDELNVYEMSDYDKVCAIYDYVCSNISYSKEVENNVSQWGSEADWDDHSAYGGLILKETVCQGYCTLMYRMLLQAGIENRVIVGETHGWNLVQLDGKNYLLDATWDAGNEVYLYFLNGQTSFREDHDVIVGDTIYTTVGAEGHRGDPTYITEEFKQKYPTSPTDYGVSLSKTGEYMASGQCGDNVFWTLDWNGLLTVSGNGAMWDVLDTMPWDGYGEYVKKAVIKNGITSISDMAFYNNCSMEEVSIPETVTSIGFSAFGQCDSLKAIEIPNSVKEVGEEAFIGCSSLKQATLSKKMTKISKNMFRYCVELESVEITEGIKEIDMYAFGSCLGLKGISFPKSLQTIKSEAFLGAFDVNGHVKLIVPENVEVVEKLAFAASEVYEVVWNSKSEHLESLVFAECPYLRKVEISDRVTSIGEGTFRLCNDLRYVKLPDNLQKTDKGVFEYCRGLQEIEIPGSLKQVAEEMFIRCENLTSIVFHDGTEIIEEDAFQACYALEELTLPASIKKLGNFAFGWCNGLKRVYFEGEPPKISSGEGTPFQDVHGDLYYWEEKGNWTQKLKDRLTNAGSVFWIARHAADAEHVVSIEWRSDLDFHWHQCQGCELEYDRGEHVYDSKSDLSCNVCDAVYMFDTPVGEVDWYYDEFTHWKGIVDQNFVDEGPHEFTYEQDADCNICGYIREVEHKHKNVFSYDEESHYMECETCGERSNVNPHAFKSDCSAKCNACKFTREAGEHQYIILAHNDEKHWMECACGLKAEQEEHIWQESKIGNVIMYECEYCDAEKEEYESSDDLLDASEETSKEPSVHSYTDEPSGGNNIVIIISVLAAVLLLGGIGFAVVIKKKNKN